MTKNIFEFFDSEIITVLMRVILRGLLQMISFIR